MIRCLALVLLAASAAHSAEPEAQGITMAETVALALRQHPLAEAYRAAAEAQAAAARSSAAWPDPVLSASSERLARLAGPEGEESETTVLLSQRLRLGGRAAGRAADAAGHASGAVRDEGLIDLARVAAEAYVDVLAAESQRELARHAAGLAERRWAAQEQRAAAGDSSASATAAARAELAIARAAAGRADAEAAGARATLVRLCGDGRLASATLQPPPLPPVPSSASTIDTHPAIVRWQQTARQAQAEIAASAGDRWQPEVGVGGVRSEGDGHTGLVVTLELPLPVSAGHRHAAHAARARLREAEAMVAAERLRLAGLRDRAVAQHAAAERALRELLDSALPAAQEAERAAIVARDAGALGDDAVADAEERTLAVRREVLTAQTDRWRAAVAQWHAEGRIPSTSTP